MAGQLQRHPLTELVREISTESLSGALRLTRERAKTVIYFDAGEIIYAVSNLRGHRLAECARRWNILSEAQVASISEKSSDLEAGAALLEAGTLSQERLDALRTRQVSDLFCQVLLWTDGEWDFDPRVRLAGDVSVAVETKALLVESARRLPDDFVAARFGDANEKLFPETNVPDGINLLPTEAFVLTRVDAPLSVNEVLSVCGLPEADALRAIYTLALGGFLQRERWPSAFTAEEISRAHAVKAALAKKPAQPLPQPMVEQKSVPAAQPVAPPQEERDEQSETEALFARLGIAANHYQVLGVMRSADAADIKRAYHVLAKRFHPDRFRRNADAEQLARIESAFARIAQAYETLKDKTTRAVYDSKLLKHEQEERANRKPSAAQQPETNLKPDAPPPKFDAPASTAQPNDMPAPAQAREKFQEGMLALQQGNRALAIALLGEAARLVPNEPRYRAHFGQALATNERLRRNAEAEIKAAIALDANNASYRVMLAELYSEIGLIRRAQGELERALTLDPRNDAARRLLNNLKGRG